MCPLLVKMMKCRSHQRRLFRCLVFAVALTIMYLGLVTLHVARSAPLFTDVSRDVVTHAQYARALEDQFHLPDSTNNTQHFNNSNNNNENNNVDEKELFSVEPSLDRLKVGALNNLTFNNAAEISVLPEVNGQTAIDASSDFKLKGIIQFTTSSSDNSYHSSLLSSSLSTPSEEEIIEVDSNEQFVFPELNASSLSTIRASRIGQMNLLSFDSILQQQHEEGFNGSAAASAKEPATLAELQVAFQPVISREERLLTLYVFHTFIRACQTNNLTYFLYSGSLIGAYRHHDLIPWDDDLDVMMDARQRPNARKALASFRPEEFALHAPKKGQWKFFWTRSPVLRQRFPYSWPFIDIFFFAESGDQIYDDHRAYKDDYRFLRVHVFPLQLRPFAGALLPVPCNMKAVLNVNYAPEVCAYGTYWHKIETVAPRHLHARVACSRLFPLYPFVFRQPSENGQVVETLMKGDVQLGKIVMPKFCGEGIQT